MERELWPVLYHALQQVALEVQQKYVQLQPWVVVATLLWAALHDRPVRWACNPANWSTTTLRPGTIPSEATMSRRVDAVSTGVCWRAIDRRLRGSGPPALVAFMDGKPWPVGNYSKDPDARGGRGGGGWAKGYKLHAVWATDTLPDAWEVAPMNVSEKEVAKRLIGQLHGGGYLLAGGEYDANYLDDWGVSHGYQLLGSY